VLHAVYDAGATMPFTAAIGESAGDQDFLFGGSRKAAVDFAWHQASESQAEVGRG
jgi:hypothetical protein